MLIMSSDTRSGLWVAEPLYIVMSRCPNPELRRQAAGLLSGQSQSQQNQAQKIPGSERLKSMKKSPVTENLDTESWDISQWIEFATSSRLDVGGAVYFGKLSSDYNNNPAFFEPPNG